MKRLLLFLALLSVGAAPVKIVGPTKVDAYKLIELAPDSDVTDCGLIWDIENEDVVDVKEYGSRLVFVAPPGVYKVKLRVVSFKDKSITTSRTTVTIGGSPTPPDPPSPTDPLTVLFQAAYSAEGEDGKASKLKLLASTYQAMADQAKTVQGKKISEFIAAGHQATDMVVGKTSMLKLRRAVADWIDTQLPTTDAMIDDPWRAKASKAFSSVAAILGGLK